MRAVSASLLVVLLSTGAIAEPLYTVRDGVVRKAQFTQPCQCRALGSMYNMGDELCMDLGDGRRAYSCKMDQNVTTWKQTGKQCPDA